MEKRIGFLCCAALFWMLDADAQIARDAQPDSGFYEMNLDQLMGLEISVASMHAQTARESPGIVTLITDEEIRSMGARDLMDVLRMVQGFEFGVDVEGVVGLSVRGNWAHEGKVLLLIDGIEMNENLYSTLQFGNHYPVHDIRRIEIIRGPGSAIYGGNAEYAVINIISRSGSEWNGGQIHAVYGQMGDVPGSTSAGISGGEKFNNAELSVSYRYSESIRSNRDYKDLWNESYDMEDHSELSNHFLNTAFEYQKLQFRGIVSQYVVETRDNYDEITSKTYPMSFSTMTGELKRETQIGKNLFITPRFVVKSQQPWKNDAEIYNNEVHSFNVTSSRYTGELMSMWTPVHNLKISGGAEYFYDVARQNDTLRFVSSGTSTFEYDNVACILQGSYEAGWANITAGARYNINERFDNSFVPRISITRAFSRAHIKLLYSEAYRSPGTENLDLNPEIKPEHTRVMEIETGFNVSTCSYLTVNLFDITTSDPIIYYYNNVNDQDAYINAEKTGSRGAELNIRFKYNKGYANIAYGFYTAEGKSRLTQYAVPQDRGALLGAPNHKISMSGHIKLSQNTGINPSVSWSGKKYGVTGKDPAGNYIIEATNPLLIFDLQLNTEQLWMKGLSAGIGVHNLFNEDETYVQPYTGGHAALPGPSREIVLNLNYRFKAKSH